MRARRYSSNLASVALFLATPFTSAHAQIESGRVIDDSTLTPLVGSRVMLQHDTAGAWRTIETTQTDAQGLFQFMPHTPGVYRVALLGKKEPMYMGAVDTLAADSMQQREFRLPIVRRSEASAYQATEVDHPAQAIFGPSSPPDAGTQRLASASNSVSAEFVVGPDGSVDLSTVRMGTTSDPRLADSMRQGLTSRHFHPATIGGIPVRQIVDETVRSETRVETR